ncbi:MAG: hypothetical protein OEY29_15550 [Gammaproteobacteria bacterium]|nr:hypothetical protein [Gammaproteobacteria bacterium]
MNDWEEFLERSFNISVSEIESNPYWNILYKTKDYMISSDSVNVNVQLKPGGMSFSTHISKWPENLGLFIGKLDINYLSENQRKEVAVLLKQATRYQIKN